MICVSYTKSCPWHSDGNNETCTELNDRISAFLSNRKELRIIKKYIDRKNSVTAISGFVDMVDDGLEQKYECIIVTGFNQFANSCTAARHYILDTLYAAGIQFIVIDDGFESAKHSSQKVREYFDTKNKELHGDIFGRWIKSKGDGFVIANSVPYGYIRDNDSKHLVKDERVSAYVSEIFRRILSGQTKEEVAGYLNWERVDTPQVHREKMQGKYDPDGPDAFWNGDKISSIIKNPVYTGSTANKSNEVLIKGTHEPYITEEEFSSIESNVITMAERTADGQIVRKKLIKPFAGKLYCACCGKFLREYTDDQSGRNYYRCPGGCWHELCEGEITYPAEKLDEDLRRVLNDEASLAAEYLGKIKAGDFVSVMNHHKTELSLKIKQVFAFMDIEQRSRVPLYESFSQQKISQEKYDSALADLQERFKKSNESCDEVMDELKRLEMIYGVKNPWIVRYVNLKLPSKFDKVFLRSFIRRIEIAPDDNGGFIFNAELTEADWKKKLMEGEWEDAEKKQESISGRNECSA